MTEQVLYNSETSQWYRPDDPHQIYAVVAATYPEAFEKLYGHAVVVPPVVRSPRRHSEVAA